MSEPVPILKEKPKEEKQETREMDERIRGCLALFKEKKPKVKGKKGDTTKVFTSNAAFLASITRSKLRQLNFPPKKLAGFLKMEMIPASQAGETARIIEMLENGLVPEKSYLEGVFRASPDLYDTIIRACENCERGLRPAGAAPMRKKSTDVHANFAELYARLRKEGRFSNESFMWNLMEQRVQIFSARYALELLKGLKGEGKNPSTLLAKNKELRIAFSKAFSKTLGKAGLKEVELREPSILFDMQDDKPVEDCLAEKCILAAKEGRFDGMRFYFALLEERVPMRDMEHAQAFLEMLEKNSRTKEGIVGVQFNAKSPELIAAVFRALSKTVKGKEETIE
jgi:hypothetical protein